MSVDKEVDMNPATTLRVFGEEEPSEADILDAVFFALSDPVRRAILERLDDGPLLVSEIAAPFDISLQAVSRHIQVLVRAGLISQERTGRISRCSLEAGPVYDAALWINRYSKYWQDQFNVLAVALQDIEARKKPAARPKRRKS
jgi:DNA-binding transcriptional ArsR family regulator